MVALDSQTMAAAQPEINPPAITTGHHNPKNHHTDHDHNHDSGGVDCSYVFTSLGRQSSIYSLTLDEFQVKLSDNGKSFGSMNMDEFLSSIWTAEENQAHHHSHNRENPNSVQLPSVSVAGSEISKGPIAKQMSLPRQGSLTLPAPLCRKTVDEVWTEIQRTQQSDDEQQKSRQQTVGDSSSTQRQPTFGKMTLEDFLMKAGVVREQCGSGLPTPSAAAHHQYGFGDPQMGPTLLTRPVMGVGTGGGYQPIPSTTGESSGNAKRNNGYSTQVVGFGGRMTNGGAPGGGFAPGAGLSPVSPNGICGPGQVDNTGGQYGLDIKGLRGRKRIIDRPVEKVVERRQRRMIKNRESAARSRARKQAYTVELEAELNQLREENAKLKQAVAKIETQKKQQNYEDQNLKFVLTRAQGAQDKLRAMRRSGSCNL